MVLRRACGLLLLRWQDLYRLGHASPRLRFTSSDVIGVSPRRWISSHNVHSARYSYRTEVPLPGGRCRDVRRLASDVRYRLLSRHRKSCRVDFRYLRLRLRFRSRFRCGVSDDSTGSCRMVGSPFPPPKLMTIDCAIPTAKAASRFIRGLRLRMRSLYGSGYSECEPLGLKCIPSHALAELSGRKPRSCSPIAGGSVCRHHIQGELRNAGQGICELEVADLCPAVDLMPDILVRTSPPRVSPLRRARPKLTKKLHVFRVCRASQQCWRSPISPSAYWC